jgi:uncharacterized protein (DUF58 family)
MLAVLRALPLYVLAFAEHRLPALTRLRDPEPLPIRITRHRIYVLPTRFGIFFAFLLGAMTLGSLNYDNNPALILCFLLVSVGLTALLYAYLSLRGLRLLEVTAEPVHAGQPLTLKLRFDAVESRHRRGIELSRFEQRTAFDLDPGRYGDVTLDVPTERRGWLPVGRIKLAVRQPLGTTVAWSWLHPEHRVLVYPALESHPPPLPGDGGQGTPQRRRGPDEQLHDLRDFRTGDPMRMMAWKRSAQLGRLTVREVESPRGRDAVLDWDTLRTLPPEARIRRLARWVVDAERAGLCSELRLPGERIGPASGPAHVHACLRSLAVLEVAPASPPEPAVAS